AILLHEGQFDGARVRLPVHLGRRPLEATDAELAGFWSHLLEATSDVRKGTWELLEVGGWPENGSAANLIAWRWIRHVVVLNFSAHPAQGLVAVGDRFAGRSWVLADLLDGSEFERDGDELAAGGLYVALPPWGAHLFAVEAG